MDTGSGSELCITGVSEESAVGRKSALLELEGEEGDMGWIGIWMSWSCGVHIVEPDWGIVLMLMLCCHQQVKHCKSANLP